MIDLLANSVPLNDADLTIDDVRKLPARTMLRVVLRPFFYPENWVQLGDIVSILPHEDDRFRVILKDGTKAYMSRSGWRFRVIS